MHSSYPIFSVAKITGKPHHHSQRVSRKRQTSPKLSLIGICVYAVLWDLLCMLMDLGLCLHCFYSICLYQCQKAMMWNAFTLENSIVRYLHWQRSAGWRSFVADTLFYIADMFIEFPSSHNPPHPLSYLILALPSLPEKTPHKVRAAFFKPIHADRVKIGPLGANHDLFRAKPSCHHVHGTLQVNLPTTPFPTYSADSETVSRSYLFYTVHNMM